MSPKFRTIVCNPVKKSASMGQQYVLYTVKSSSINSSYTDINPEFSVERRYSDFVLLHKELGRLYPGAILPPLPKDQVFGRFKQDFIDSRMRALDDFLLRTHEHPDLADSSILKTFLTVAIFDESAIVASEAVASITNSEDGTHKTSSSKRSSWIDKIQNFNPTLTESQSINTSEMDAKIDAILAYTANVLPGSQSLSESSIKFLESCKAVSTDYGLCCGVYTSYGSSDNDSGSHAMGQLGHTFTSLTNYLNEHNSEFELTVKEPFEQSIYAIQCINLAVQKQKELRSTYLISVSDVENKEKAYEKEASEVKLHKLNEAKDIAEKNRIEYEEASQRLLENYERFQVQRRQETLRILYGLASLQSSYHKKCENTLSDVYSQIQQLSGTVEDELIIETLPEDVKEVKQSYPTHYAEEV